MPKLKGMPNTAEGSAVKADSWNGPWGRVSPTPRMVLTLRLCKASSLDSEESFSYPYRVLTTWRWTRVGEEEQLEIEAGPDLITLRGRGLARLVDALDVGALEVVRESSGLESHSHEVPSLIRTLTVERARGSYFLREGEPGEGRSKAE